MVPKYGTNRSAFLFVVRIHYALTACSSSNQKKLEKLVAHKQLIPKIINYMNCAMGKSGICIEFKMKLVCNLVAER